MTTKITRKLLALSAWLTGACAKAERKAVDAHCVALDNEVAACFHDCERVDSQIIALQRAAHLKTLLANDLHTAASKARHIAEAEKAKLRGV
jgi:hypothetical protein